MKNDVRLRLNVLEELKWQPAADATQINVTANNGVVTLTGSVPRYANKMEAERIAKRVIGVRAINNDIEIELNPADVRTDGEIAHSAANAFTWHTWIPQDNIQVMVREGWVTLEGTVDWQYQRTSAQEAVSQLIGVRGISNLISLTVKPQPIDITHKIELAFRRCAEVDARHVTVKTTANTVVLEGRVSSPLELAEAERVAWAAPGVTKVENRLTISE